VSRIVRIKSDGTGGAETVLETVRVAGLPSSVCHRGTFRRIRSEVVADFREVTAAS
jgi:hypothetical protein